jgi:hypothetical protein
MIYQYPALKKKILNSVKIKGYEKGQGNGDCERISSGVGLRGTY